MSELCNAMNFSNGTLDSTDPWLIAATVMIIVQVVIMVALLGTLCIMVRLYVASLPLIASIMKSTRQIEKLSTNPMSVLMPGSQQAPIGNEMAEIEGNCIIS